MGKFGNQYRPERHYMRGPGPKWREKHTASLLTAALAQREVKPAYRAQEPRGMAYSLWIVPATVLALLSFVVVVTLA